MAENKPIKFIKEVARYFMDFLESDFHKKNAPKRVISFKNDKNYLIGVDLKKYEKFSNTVWRLINKNFDKEVLNTIEKWIFYTKIPNDFLDLIKLKVDKISNEEIEDIIKNIALQLTAWTTLYKKELDEAISYFISATYKIFQEKLLASFFQDLETPIENLKLWDENSIFIMEDELTNILVSEVEEKWKDIIKKILAKEDVSIEDELKECVTLDSIRITILSFFDNFKVLDLYEELSELIRNKSIMDKQDFYLYFYDITYKSVKYPIFYIPFSLKKESQKIYITFDSQVYYNKKAIEYIVQEYNNETWNASSIKTNHDRIIYISDENVALKVKETIDDIVDFFKLSQEIDVNNFSNIISRWKFCKVSNSCYINLFDKSDEALINDYEEILTKLTSEDDELWNWFITLVDDFIYNEPKKVTFEIKENRNEQDIWEKLTYRSPIPLNEEQQQILSAVKNDSCKYIIVQWPPWTWKSHTITAVVFDQILKDKSVLVLSDKKEALDVVEDKITDTMNKVRIHEDFQNPILRLWKTWNTFSSILSPSHVSKISDSYFAEKSKEKEIEENIERINDKLKDYIEKESDTYKQISLWDIQKFFSLEKELWNDLNLFDIDELIKSSNGYNDLIDIRELLKFLNNLFVKHNWDLSLLKLLSLLNLSINNINNLAEFDDILWKCGMCFDKLSSLKNKYSEYELWCIKKFSDINDKNFEDLKQIVKRYQNEKQFLFWFFFKKKVLSEIERDLKNDFWFKTSWDISNDIRDINNVIQIISEWKTIYSLFNFDCIEFIFQLMTDDLLFESLNRLKNEWTRIKTLRNFAESYPSTMANLSVDINSFSKLCVNDLISLDDLTFSNIVEYIRISGEINRKFESVPNFDYNNEKKKVENLSTMQMTQIMDKRFIEFYENHKNTAMTIKKIIQKKTKFPKQDFDKLKAAFPCILAWIRDYAEYIPLEPELFDLVIIDEASQVSIAQAFPALLRAKKVLVLWDKKQFSNVKTSLASIKQNQEYLNNLRQSFTENVSKDTAHMVKLEMFNIKSSILDFCEYICNYEAMLKKYFRWYKEIISYSNKFFYSNNLQVMKIRWKPITDVLRFEFIKHDWRIELRPNTNSMEIDFIISELEKLRDCWSKQTVWIITPHTNQQKALVDAINKVANNEYFYDVLKLKIMTFDSCQWEERDIIYYSMVATEADDHLWWVFAKDLSAIDIEEDWKIKAQRLNVWFSRAKESMVFVLSKDIGKFSWEIHNTLSHYWKELENAKKEPTIDEVDPQSPMEKEVLNWILQTEFYKNNIDRIEFKPQFEIWKYLKQLDPTYNHPKYKVDFLLIYKDIKTSKETKIIIEYDWFKEHFTDLWNVDKDNWHSYMKEDDIYREKVLESYWYKFIRINKFNIGRNPVWTIHNKIESLIADWSDDEEPGGDSSVIWEIKWRIEWLSNWTMKQCPECLELRSIESFKDSKLKSGMWKICMFCKQAKEQSKIKERRVKQEKARQEVKEANSSIRCPRCWSKMYYRRWRYWPFYWCSRFPYCRWTRRI